MRDAGDGQTEVAAIDPVTSMERTGYPELASIAEEVRAGLRHAVERARPTLRSADGSEKVRSQWSQAVQADVGIDVDDLRAGDAWRQRRGPKWSENGHLLQHYQRCRQPNP